MVVPIICILGSRDLIPSSTPIGTRHTHDTQTYNAHTTLIYIKKGEEQLRKISNADFWPQDAQCAHIHNTERQNSNNNMIIFRNLKRIKCSFFHTLEAIPYFSP